MIEASTGKEGIEKARAHRPDVVLLDVVLPDISGIEVVRQIKEDRDLKQIFVILLSGVRVSPEYQANGLNMGADGYIAKPVSNKELLARVESMVRIRRAEEALQASETRYRRLFETAQDGILILDGNTGEIDDVNPFLIDMLGYTYKDFLGKRLWELGAFKDAKASKKSLCRHCSVNGVYPVRRFAAAATRGPPATVFASGGGSIEAAGRRAGTPSRDREEAMRGPLPHGRGSVLRVHGQCRLRKTAN